MTSVHHQENVVAKSPAERIAEARERIKAAQATHDKEALAEAAIELYRAAKDKAFEEGKR
jgi:hypothetical protein